MLLSKLCVELYFIRSAVLFSKSEFIACIHDIERALKIGYPENLCHKLYERRGKCFMKLNDYCQALKDYQMAMKQGSNNIKEESKLLPFQNDVQKWIQVCQDKVNKSVSLKLSEKSEPQIKDINETIPALSSGVRIVHNGKVRISDHFIILGNFKCIFLELLYFAER